MTAYVPFNGHTMYATCPDPGAGQYAKVEVRMKFDDFLHATPGGSLFGGAIAGIKREAINGYGWLFLVRADAHPYRNLDPGDTPGNLSAKFSNSSGYLTAEWMSFVSEYSALPDGTLNHTARESSDTTEDHASVTWSTVGTDSFAYTGIPASSVVADGYALVVGTDPFQPGDHNRVNCKMYRCVVLIDDVVVADFYPNQDAAAEGDTTWTDSYGNVWTLTNTSVVGDPTGFASATGTMALTGTASGEASTGNGEAVGTMALQGYAKGTRPGGFVDPDTVHRPGLHHYAQADWGRQVGDNLATLWEGFAQDWRYWNPNPSFVTAAGLLEMEAYFHQIGHSCTAMFGIQISATTTLAAGDVTIDLPLSAVQTAGQIFGTCLAYDSSAGTYYGGLLVGSTAADNTICRPWFDVNMSSTHPFTWAAGDTLTGHLFYEVVTAEVPSDALFDR